MENCHLSKKFIQNKYHQKKYLTIGKDQKEALHDFKFSDYLVEIKTFNKIKKQSKNKQYRSVKLCVLYKSLFRMCGNRKQ